MKDPESSSEQNNGVNNNLLSKYDDENQSPETRANSFSRLFYNWAQPLFRRASDLHRENRALQQEDLIALPKTDLGKTISPVFEEAWKDQQAAAEKSNVFRALRPVLGRRFTFAGVIKFFNTCVQFLFPLLLNEILRFIEETEEGSLVDDAWHVKYRGYWLASLLFLAMGTKAVTENFYFHCVYRASYQARVAVSVAVYNKSLRLTSSERQTTTLGELINLMQVDASKIELFVPQFHVLWDGAFQILGYMVILYSLIGWPCFAGLIVMVLAGPGQGVIMKRLYGLNRYLVKHTDERVKTTNEAVQGIRCLKMYSWEESFQQVISKGRSGELDVLREIAYLRGFSRAYMGALPGVVAVASFFVYAVVYEGDIEASTLFAALVAFGQLRFPLLFYPMALATYAQADVSAKRIESFLGLKEINTGEEEEKIYNRKDETLKKGELVANNVTIYWSDPNTPINVAVDSNDSESPATSKPLPENNGRKDNKSTSIIDAESTDQLKYPGPVLSDVSMNVAPGELCAIIGRVGSGKSTLSAALLNEAIIGSGSISLNGNVAFAAQSSWILNASVRDNITFGLPYDKEKYEKIIFACQLTHDLSFLPAGDLTEIGEKGINLSGGQKQRVSMARAAYSNADYILMDDPLSALDPEVGKKLFDECIVKLMRNKTRILITNGLQYLQYCDNIIALDQGKVSEQGTFQELLTGDGDIQNLLEELQTSNMPGDSATDSYARPRSDSASSGRKREESDAEDIPDAQVKNKGRGDVLITEEERNVGAVSWEVYRKYIKAGGGFAIFSIAFLMFVMCAGIELLSVTWIALWTADSEYEKQSESFYLGYYALTAVGLGIVTFLRSYILARFGVHASFVLHKNVLASVLHAPMSFFDTTPSGRILSRFSKDLYAVDLELSDYLDFFLYSGLFILVSFGSITFVTPWFGVAIFPIVYIYIKVLNYFREVSRETKRLESISRSPVFAHFSETLGGLGTIRAYEKSSRFISDFEQKVDVNTRATYNNRCADRWLSVRLELLGALIGGLSAVFVTNAVISNADSAADTSNFASAAGLSLNYAISITGLLNWVIRSFAQMEAAMNAAERVLYYTENIPQDAPNRSYDLKRVSENMIKTNSSNEPLSASSIAVKAMSGIETSPPGWPSSGNITITNLEMKYRPETPLVIKGLNVEITGGSRVGVVGRTGSGKSSLLLTLMRIVEPANVAEKNYQPPIVIDGVDILRIGLADLREAIGIVPQNPALFSGTIRSNMDPFDEHTDEAIWDALDGCGMKDVIEDMPSLLDSSVSENGDNYSQGQRQLLCLGRALLKQCQILLLDEATSSVDYETDKEIQMTLRKAFKGCTVLTIAHRVNTILDSDMILVMADGRASEYGAPKDLLADTTSAFSDIVSHSEIE